MGSQFIDLRVQQYCAVPTSQPRGLVTADWRLDVARTALVALHCWNIGVPGGIPVPEDYWVFMGSPQNHAVMSDIVERVIAPLLDKARGAGMPVVHVQTEPIAARYAALQPPVVTEDVGSCRPTPVTDDWARHVAVTHGPGMYEWPGWADLDAAPQVRPHPGDVMVATTAQFDAWLRARGIETLLYTGFSTNLCILNSPGAMKAMRDRGYRCVIVREATLGCEFPETQASLDHTRAALRFIETWVGYSAGVADLCQALVAI